MAEPRDFDSHVPSSGDRDSKNTPAPDDTQTYVNLAFRLQEGAMVGARYRIVRMLGMGGMGMVYQAHDLELEQDVALKIIRPELLQNEEATERFKRELLLARKVSHRNVVRIHDIGEFEGLKYLTMSFIEGESLRDVLRSSGPLEPERAEQLFHQICEAVGAAHEEGVIHRDLKPANILLDRQDRVFITDFGIARSQEVGDLTVSGVLVGTPAYLAPELLDGDPATARSDVHALGILLFEMLTGKLPSRDPRKTAQRLKVSGAKIPGKLVAVIRRCLETDPRRRFSGADEIVKALDGEASGRLPAALEAIAGRRLLNWGMAAVTLLVIATALWLAWPFLQTEPPVPAVRRSVVVLPLENRTENQQLDWMQAAAADLLIADLSRSPHLRTVSGERTLQTLTDLKLEDYDLDQAEVKRLANIFDVDIVLKGAFTQVGQNLRLDLQLIDLLRQEGPAYFQADGSSDAFLALVSDLAEQVRRRLRAQPRTDGSAARVFTESIESLEEYQQGAARFRSGDYQEAARFLRRSIELDPQFVAAYLLLSRSHEFAGDREQAHEVLERAREVTGSPDARGARIVRARLALMDGEVDRAVQLFEELTAAYPEDPDLLFEAALAQEDAGNLEEAVKLLEQVVQLDPTHPRAFFHLGKNTILLGESEKALGEHLVKGLAVSTQLNDLYGKADIVNAMGVAYERLGRYDEAIEHYRQSHDLKQQVGNKQGAATSLSNVANIMIFQGRYDEAEGILEQTRELFQEVNYQPGIANTVNQFGVIYEDRGDFKQALDYYKEGLQLRKRLGLDLRTAQSYDNVGYIYYLTGEYDNADVYWKQALELKQNLGDERGVIISNQNMGFLQTAQGDLDAATRSFLEALERSRAIKLENGTAVSLGNLAHLYQMQGRYRAAFKSYREAIEILRRLDDKRGLAEYTKLQGDALMEIFALDEADPELKQALAWSREIGSTELEADILVLLANLSRLRDRPVEADDWLQQAFALLKEAPGMHKSRLRARIEQALLLAAQNRLSEAASTLTAAGRDARRIGNVRLEIMTDYAATKVELRRQDYRAALTSAESGLQRAAQMGLKPYLLRLESLAGEASLALGKTEQAGTHFREAAAHLQQIADSTEERYRQGLHEIPEVRLAEDRLKAAEGVGEAP